MLTIHATTMRRLLKSKKFICFVSLLGVIAIRVATQPNGRRDASGDPIHLFYQVFNDNVMVYLIIPLFLWMAEVTSDLFDRHKVLLKYHNRTDWWSAKVIDAVLIAGVTVCVLNAVMVMTSFLVARQATQSIVFWSLTLFCMLLQWLCLSVAGVLYFVAVLVWSHKQLGFMVTAGTFFLLQAGTLLLKVNYPSIGDGMTLFQSYPFHSYWPADEICILCLLVGLGCMYMGGRVLIRRKDIYWSDAS